HSLIFLYQPERGPQSCGPRFGCIRRKDAGAADARLRRLHPQDPLNKERRAEPSDKLCEESINVYRIRLIPGRRCGTIGTILKPTAKERCIMPHTETMLESKEIFNGRVIRVTLDTVRLENGN